MSSKRLRLSLKEKANIINRLEQGETVTKLAKEYEIAKSTICLIKSKKDNILKWSSNVHSPQNRKNLSMPDLPEMEKSLYSWFLGQIAKEGCPINNISLKAKAIELHNKIKENKIDFVASDGWLRGFKIRHGIYPYKVRANKMSSRSDLMAPFSVQLREKKEELNLCRDQIYYAEESELFCKLLPEEICLSSNETSDPNPILDKQKITFLCCTNSTGEHKLKILTVSQLKKPRDLKNDQLQMDYKSSPSACMTAAIFKDWFHNSFILQVKNYLKNKGLPMQALLLIDNAPHCPVQEELKSEDGMIVAMFLPPHILPLINAMEQNISRFTKLNYTNILEDAIDSSQLDIVKAMKKITLTEAIIFLRKAWTRVSAHNLSDCWNIIETAVSDDDSTEIIPLENSKKMLNENVNTVARTKEDESQVCCSIEKFFECNKDTMFNSIDLISKPGIKNENDSPTEENIDLRLENKAAEVAEALNVVLEWAEDEHINQRDIEVLWRLRLKAVVAARKTNGGTT